MTLIFVGGPKASGKSSLAKDLVEALGIDYLHTGSVMREDKTRFQENFVQKLSEMDDVLIDTHYAVSFRNDPYDFSRGLEQTSLELIRQHPSDKQAVLLTAHPEIIQQRRIQDLDRRLRCTDLPQIERELELNRTYWQDYSRYLNAKAIEIPNNGELSLAVEQAYNFIRNLS